jgi:uncharacterized protein (DUF1778 family)
MNMATVHHVVKQEKLNMRINSEERGIIDRAAKIRGKNRTDFILNAARKEAEETIYEQTMIKASPEAYAEFLHRLDKAPMPNERLIKTMQTKAPWDKE